MTKKFSVLSIISVLIIFTACETANLKKDTLAKNPSLLEKSFIFASYDKKNLGMYSPKADFITRSPKGDGTFDNIYHSFEMSEDTGLIVFPIEPGTHRIKQIYLPPAHIWYNYNTEISKKTLIYIGHLRFSSCFRSIKTSVHDNYENDLKILKAMYPALAEFEAENTVVKIFKNKSKRY